MKTIRLLATVLLVGLTIGCASISYKPSLSLGTSPSSVHARVQMNQLADASPPDEKETKFAGFAATEPGTLAGDLATEVTNALLTDFSNNQVFDTIQKRMTNPDLVMNGTIHRFYAQSGINALGWSTVWMDFIWLFGLPIQSQYGAVDIELTLQRPDGTTLGTYHGKSEFSESFSMYTNIQLAIGTRLNKAFDEAVGQIRSQLMNDADKLAARTDAH
ncbi:MAG: hypothetical protein E6J56_09305 [Deltaproteobacteria bacterium]|nr:MAG: hypothetical protein E6J56_09305 [Deltaproteobacteria bacterium]